MPLVRTFGLYHQRQDLKTTHIGSIPNSHSVQRLVFDPDAVVVLTCGTDQQPGIADWDDDQNGTVDDDLELGAMQSDDQVVIRTHASANRLPSQPQRPVFVGAFVRDFDPQPTLASGAQQRQTVSFQQKVGDDRVWMMVEKASP